MERDGLDNRHTRLVIISTHTLTWSVTYALRKDFLRSGISTHTLTWSVTSLLSAADLMVCISTHTLTWSVTS